MAQRWSRRPGTATHFAPEGAPCAVGREPPGSGPGRRKQVSENREWGADRAKEAESQGKRRALLLINRMCRTAAFALQASGGGQYHDMPCSMKRWLTKTDIEDVVEIWRKIRGNALARNAGYLILAAIAVQSGIINYIIILVISKFIPGSSISPPSDWVPIALSAIAAVLLICDRILPVGSLGSENPNPHDEELIQLVREKLLKENIQHFVRMHDFGNSFPRKRVDPFLEACDTWVGPKYEFVDAEMQAVWLEAYAAICDFALEVAASTAPAWGNPEWQTVHPKSADPELPSERTLAEIKLLNEKASKMMEALDQLERLAKQRLVK